MSDDPLVVTLRLDDASQAYFDALRTAYFPPERLHVGAHVTMFYAIPAPCEARLAACVAKACRETVPFGVKVCGTRLLGRGVAYVLRSPQAQRLRATIADDFANEFTRQDAASWSPHMTIQNKVTPAQAKDTRDRLAMAGPAPPVVATGVAIWRYKGGPWDRLTAFGFSSS